MAAPLVHGWPPVCVGCLVAGRLCPPAFVRLLFVHSACVRGCTGLKRCRVSRSLTSVWLVGCGCGAMSVCASMRLVDARTLHTSYCYFWVCATVATVASDHAVALHCHRLFLLVLHGSVMLYVAELQQCQPKVKPAGRACFHLHGW